MAAFWGLQKQHEVRVVQVEIVAVPPVWAKTGGRLVILCPACGRRCRSLWPSPAAVVRPWEPRPEPWRVPAGTPVGFVEVLDLELAPGATSLQSWACRDCHGMKGHPMRGGPVTRQRYLVATRLADPRRGQRRVGTGMHREVKREARLQKALAKLAAIDAAQAAADLANLEAALAASSAGD